MLPDTSHNPDVLTCLANLSNDEVFTPPPIANQMLDLLPKKLWEDETATFLDPVSKSGVFLREIAKRLIKGLEPKIPDLETRLEHIFTKQIFGIAITELTALLSRRSVYCSKLANGKFSVSPGFDNKDGNILFSRARHRWKKDRCLYCGASIENFNRESSLETHAYKFIHTKKPEEIFNMKFDVIIGNPPYQLNDGGGSGTSAVPIYQRFVEQAIKLNPRYLCMITPSRWFSGGKGLSEYRSKMLQDSRLTEIHDFIDANDCFPGVQIKGGVSYFLWTREKRGQCNVFSYNKNKLISKSKRKLLEDGLDTFIRFNEGVNILRKIKKHSEGSIIKNVSYRNPYGLASNFKGFSEVKDKDHNVKLYRYGDVGYITPGQISKNKPLLKKIKVIISKAGSGSDSFPHQIIGVPIISKPNSVSTETYLVLGVFKKLKEAENFISYVKTRFFRFLVSLIKISQNAPRDVYMLVPEQDYSEPWDDEKLYSKYGLNNKDIKFIEAMIKPMELTNEK